ncbi:MAG TPA: PRTRC system ThiF family protein [Chitinophagaceae bacterium]|nr:PRTRC system ThiF family protein [Chitinophagaceae bacterium]
MKTKTSVHFVDNSLLRPTNPVTVNLVGAGGTGSQVLSALARINYSLVALRHPGISVKVFDGDIITTANLGRQLFAATEIGMNKGVALINRINRFFGTNWKAVPAVYDENTALEEKTAAITISCVDTVKARFDISHILGNAEDAGYGSKPVYWMDFGNLQYTGQVLISTVQPVPQPASRKFQPVASLPLITQEFKELLVQAGKDTTTPSCSLAEALSRQDLFINSSLASLGASLLWNMFREGMLFNRGFFLNVKDFKTQPVKV